MRNLAMMPVQQQQLSWDHVRLVRMSVLVIYDVPMLCLLPATNVLLAWHQPGSAVPVCCV